MRHQYFQYLVDSGQEERAAALKEHEGDNLGAISLYLRGGYPARALAVAMAQKMGPSSFPKEVLERVAAALAGAGMYDKCGALLERMGDQVRAMDAYLRGRVPAFRPAVELARRAFPSRVVELERSWGEWLVQHKQVDAAINHFIEAGAHIQAINAALDARQFSKAAQLVQDTLHEDEKVARPFWRRLAKNFQERGNLEEAERYLLRAGDGRAAVDLYLQAGKFEAAHRVARSCMSESEIATLYTQQAQRSEAAGQLRQAERLYLAVRLYDNAILMFRRAKSWDSVVRVVAAHRPEQLKDTSIF
jgi:intraflagellar transport protein 172